MEGAYPMTTKTPEQIARNLFPNECDCVPNYTRMAVTKALKEYGDQVRRETVEECRQAADKKYHEYYAKMEKVMRLGWSERYAKELGANADGARVVEIELAALLEGERQ